MWTDDEDAQLRTLVEEYGMKKWALVSSKMENKGAKQCRRWGLPSPPVCSARDSRSCLHASLHVPESDG